MSTPIKIVAIFIHCLSVLLAFGGDEGQLSLRELELSSGRVVVVRMVLKLDDTALLVETPDGRRGRVRPEQLSDRERQRRFGWVEPPAKPAPRVRRRAGLEMVATGLNADFDRRGFVNSFEVKAEDLAAEVHTGRYRRMPYRFFAPSNLKSGEKVPLVLFFHGMGECGDDNLKQLKHPQFLIFAQPLVQEKHPCFVLAPQLGGNWRPWVGHCDLTPGNASIDMHTAMEILDAMIAKYPEIDEDRIYVTGLSSGGNAALEAVIKYPGRFAGAFPNSAGWEAYLIPLMESRQRVAIWAFINERENPRVKAGCEAVLRRFGELGGECRMTIGKLGGGHAAWEWAYAEPELIPWLFVRRRDTAAAHAAAAEHASRQ